MNRRIIKKASFWGGLMAAVFFASCTKNDYTSYCPTWYGFTYETGNYPNYVQGVLRNVVLHPGDSIHITAHQKERGHQIHSTDYVWTICYDVLDTKNNDDPSDDEKVHMTKEYRQHTNYDGYVNGSDDPVGHLLLPDDALPTGSTPDTIKFVAYYKYSATGIQIDNGSIVDNTSYNGRITPQSGAVGGGAAGYFYFNVE